jgi:hypothetical protein
VEAKDQPFLPGYFNASSAFVRNKKDVKKREVPTDQGENNQGKTQTVELKTKLQRQMKGTLRYWIMYDTFCTAQFNV